ncbi:thioesterase family protein [Cetobacterium sp.]|uniref:thioesterase family protein n=1 Tax=Cetobacterium sp. TaxID=2071632 RepID=UPI0025D0728A|nr:thioesterase family protein [uncultured Cetobacterium sp.]
MFVIDYKVTISDINYGGHMGNERALLLFQEVRINLFKILGGSEINLGENVGTIQKDAHVYYKGEVYLGEKLKVKIVGAELKKASINFLYEIENENNQIVIEGTTLIVGFNYTLKKISKFPEELLTKLKNII